MRIIACDVCRILDGDESPQPCEWCSLCKAWLCVRDQFDILRRARAGFMRAGITARNALAVLFLLITIGATLPARARSSSCAAEPV